MSMQRALLAAAAVLTLAAPAAAFADPYAGGGYADGYRQSGQDGGGYDRQTSQYGRGYAGGWDGRNDGYRGYDRRDDVRGRAAYCRRGVFYMRRSVCAVQHGYGYGRWNDHAYRSGERNGW